MRLRIWLCLIVSSVASLATTPVLTISKDNQIPIVLPDNPTESERYAASELKHHLHGMLKIKPRILLYGKRDMTPAIHIGLTELAKRNIPGCQSLGSEEWVVKTAENCLILAGGRPRGSLYAVYEFLESVGVVWPSPAIEHMPVLNEITVAPCDLRGKPAFVSREVYSGFSRPTPELRKWQVRNKLNTPSDLSPAMGGSFHSGRPGSCHTFWQYAKDEWPDEWFSMTEDGRRVRSLGGDGPGQFCLTNPELRKAMIERLREFIELDRQESEPDFWPAIYDISKNDSEDNIYCKCPGCRALAEAEGSYSGPMLDFINAIANGIAADYPEIYVRTFAYSWTLDAPRTIKAAPNVIVQICKLGCEFFPNGKADTLFPNVHPRNKNYHDNFIKWSEICGNMAVWDYWVIYTKPFQPPYLSALNIREDLRFYRDRNVKFLFAECEYNSTSSFADFKLWYGLKLMQNPDSSYDELALRFCQAYYGPAAKLMKEYMDYLQERENAADVSIGAATIFEMPHTNAKCANVKNILPYLDEQFFEKVNFLLAEAENFTQRYPQYLNNVRKERVPVDACLVNNPASVTADLYQRYADNSRFRTEICYGPINPYVYRPEVVQNTLDSLEKKEKILFDADFAVPSRFAGREVVLYDCTKVSGKIIYDDDAYKGKAALLREVDKPGYHLLPLSMGVRNKLHRKDICRFTYDAGQIPQDEKYHWFNLGKCSLQETAYLWVHWSTFLRCGIDNAMLAGSEWEVFVSVKVTGKPYVNHSTAKTQILVDRIILAR